MPRNRLVLENEEYEVVSGQPVTITIRTGDGQAGGTTAEFDNEVIDIFEGVPLEIGAPGRDLSGLSINPIAIVKDISSQHDHTSIVIKVEGGRAEANYEYSANAYDDKTMVIYDVLVEFN